MFCGNEAAAAFPDPEWPANVRVVRAPIDAAIKPLRLAAELTWLPAAADHHGVELLHSLGTTAPLHGRAVRVTTVHDLIYEHFPGAFPPAARRGLQLVVPAAARRSARVQVSSSYTKGDVVEHFGLDPAKIDVVPLGLGMRDVPEPTPEAALRERLELGRTTRPPQRQRRAPAQEPRAAHRGGRAAPRAGARARRACGSRHRAAASARRWSACASPAG